MGTGYAVTQSCPARGPTYTEYFIRGSPPEVCALQNPYAYMPPMDSAWYDEEWSMDPAYADTVTVGGDVAPGVYWPELEALRRRIRMGQEDMEVGGGVTLPPPPAPRPGVTGGEAPTPVPPSPPQPEPADDGLPGVHVGGEPEPAPPPAPPDTAGAL